MRVRLTWSLVLAVLAGCIATPQPNPPGLDVRRVAASGGGRDHQFELLGEAGAIDPAEAYLWVTALDATSDPRVVMPAADGSFGAMIEPGRHRLQPRLGEVRGAIVDVEIEVGLAVIERSLPCLSVPLEEAAPSVLVGGSGEVEVELRNDCGDAVTISAAMRRASDFEIIDAPLRVEAASTVAIRVRFAPSAAGEREETLLIDVSGAAAERRWVTLYGFGAR